MPDRKKDISYVKTTAIRYLSRMPRTTREVELRLQKKGVDSSDIKEVICYLSEAGYLNDEVFAKNWINSKLKNHLWGRNRIIHGLKQKDVPEEIIKKAITRSDLETTELNTAKTALEKWLRNKNKPDIQIKQRAFRYLLGIGFPASTIITAIKEITSDCGELTIYEGQ